MHPKWDYYTFLRMSFRKIAILVSSLLALILLIAFVVPGQNTSSYSSSNGAISGGFSRFAGFLGFNRSSQGSEEDGIVSPSLLKKETPDNLYWLAVATPTNPAERKAQDELRENWATLYGKIYSGKATKEEIDEYFKAQIKLQEDQLELLNILEEKYPDKIDNDKRRMIAAGKELYSKKLKNVTEEYKKYANNKP